MSLSAILLLQTSYLQLPTTAVSVDSEYTGVFQYFSEQSTMSSSFSKSRYVNDITSKMVVVLASFSGENRNFKRGGGSCRRQNLRSLTKISQY